MPFRFPVLPVALSVSILAVGAAPLVAQSLADIARQEQARRQEIKQPAKVYTNKDLGSVPPSSATPQTDKPATDAAAVAKEDVKNAAKQDAGDKDSKDKPVVKDQKYWSARMKTLTTELERDQSYSEAMQTRVNVLTADFSARDDPAQRAAIGADRQKAIDELARLKKALADEKKAITDLEDEARRALVPPGWLR